MRRNIYRSRCLCGARVALHILCVRNVLPFGREWLSGQEGVVELTKPDVLTKHVSKTAQSRNRCPR